MRTTCTGSSINAWRKAFPESSHRIAEILSQFIDGTNVPAVATLFFALQEATHLAECSSARVFPSHAVGDVGRNEVVDVKLEFIVQVLLDRGSVEE